ncbi:MAG: hypothetical protein ACO1Q7_02760 [Gemmatimonas sp.]
MPHRTHPSIVTPFGLRQLASKARAIAVSAGPALGDASLQLRFREAKPFDVDPHLLSFRRACRCYEVKQSKHAEAAKPPFHFAQITRRRRDSAAFTKFIVMSAI